MGETEVSFESGHGRVLGTLRVPSREECSPLAILVHGFGSFRNELTGFVELAGRLAENGIVSLRLVCAAAAQAVRAARCIPAWEWVEDLRNATSFAETRPEIDPERIGVVGMSMGGGVACTGAALDKRLRAIVALAPVADGEAWLRHLWVSARGDTAWQTFLREIDDDRRARVLTGRSRQIPVLDAMAYAPQDRDAFLDMTCRYLRF